MINISSPAQQAYILQCYRTSCSIHAGEKAHCLKVKQRAKLNLEFHHRFDHDLRQDKLWSVLAINIAYNLPAIKTFLLKHTHKNYSKTYMSQKQNYHDVNWKLPYPTALAGGLYSSLCRVLFFFWFTVYLPNLKCHPLQRYDRGPKKLDVGHSHLADKFNSCTKSEISTALAIPKTFQGV